MVYIKNTVYLVTLIALAVLIAGTVSAADFANISVVKVNGVTGNTVASFAGSAIPVEVQFVANANASDTVVSAWISGHKGDTTVETKKFPAISGSTYVKFFSVPIPSDINPTETLTLQVMIDSNAGSVVYNTTAIKLAAQRESYVIEILNVNMDTKVKAGDNLLMNVVLKNRGFEMSSDTFVKATIPALGIETTGYFGDLSAVDGTHQANPDKQDAGERTLALRVPANTPAGVYAVQIEAYNADSVSTMTKKVAVVGAGDDSQVIPSSTAKTFAVGEKATYLMTLVNSGNKIRVYNVVVDTPTGLTVNTESSVVVVPAGSSVTVKLEAQAAKAGEYNFAADVNADGALVKTQSFTAKVEGTSSFAGSTGNTTLVLTVVLAIVFVVLLVVLIVLLTRKPKKEEFGESYY
jgi:hypothetical protein